MPEKPTTVIIFSKTRTFITGLLMGVADLVPGVSGGTIALLLGIYDKLIDSIKLVTTKSLSLLLKGRVKDSFDSIPFHFLLPLLGGIVTAIFGFVYVIEYLLDNYPIYLWSLFMGLVIGTIILVSKRIKAWSLQKFSIAVFSALIVFYIVGLPATNADTTLFTMFFTGAIAICAMILPGISGSLLMVIMGQYENVIGAINDFKIQLLAAFAAGAAIGLSLFSRLVSWLLHHYHQATYAALVGLMIGALRAVWPWQVTANNQQIQLYLPDITTETMISVLLFTGGLYIVKKLEQAGVAREQNDQDI